MISIFRSQHANMDFFSNSVTYFIKTEPILCYLFILSVFALFFALLKIDWILNNSVKILSNLISLYSYLSFLPFIILIALDIYTSKTLFSQSHHENFVFSFVFALFIFSLILFVTSALIKIKKIKKYEIKLLVIFTVFLTYLDFLIMFKLLKCNEKLYLTLSIVYLVPCHYIWLIFLLKEYRFYLFIKTIYDAHHKILTDLDYIEEHLIPASVNTFGEMLRLYHSSLEQSLQEDILRKSCMLVGFVRSLKTSFHFVSFRNYFNNEPLIEFLDQVGEDYSLDQIFFDVRILNADIENRLLYFKKEFLRYISHLPILEIYEKNIELAKEFGDSIDRLKNRNQNLREVNSLILKYQNYFGFAETFERFRNEYIHELNYLTRMTTAIPNKMFQKIISHLRTSLKRFDRLQGIFKDGIQEIKDYENSLQNSIV